MVFTASITFSAVIQDILIDPILFDVENSLLSKADKLNKKIAKHCTNVQELVNFGQLIEALDEFTGMYSAFLQEYSQNNIALYFRTWFYLMRTIVIARLCLTVRTRFKLRGPCYLTLAAIYKYDILYIKLA